MKNKVIIYGCLGIVLCFIMSIPIVNDYCAYMVEKELCATPLPENTQLIDSVSKAGKLTGNGNGMQYLGAILKVDWLWNSLIVTIPTIARMSGNIL